MIERYLNEVNNKSQSINMNGLLTVKTTILLALITNTDHALAKSSSNECQQVSTATAAQILDRKIEHHVLDNGLTVYLQSDKNSDTFTMRTIVNVGGRDEKPGESGYAHLFEHMMFKGTKNVADGVFFNAIQTVGGRSNATTNYDRTDYWQSLPATFLTRALYLESDRMQNLQITEKKLLNQIEAVLEEKKLRLDNVPYAGVVSRFMIKQWHGTPYDHLLIGTDAELKAAEVASVSAFLDEYYVANNSILTLVGHFETQAALQQIKRYFATWKKGQANQRKTFIKPKQRKIQANLHDPLAPFPGYGIAWHTVGKSHPDYLGVEILTDILLRHSAARIKRILKEDKTMVFEIIGLPLTFEDVGLANIAFIPRSFTSFKEVKTIIKATINDVKKHGVKNAELCRAIKTRQLDLLRQFSTNRGRAILIGDGASYFGDPQYYAKLLTRYNDIDNDTMIRIANTYFTDQWISLQVNPGWTIRVLKWILEVLPRPVGEKLEQQFL